MSLSNEVSHYLANSLEMLARNGSGINPVKEIYRMPKGLQLGFARSLAIHYSTKFDFDETNYGHDFPGIPDSHVENYAEVIKAVKEVKGSLPEKDRKDAEEFFTGAIISAAISNEFSRVAKYWKTAHEAGIEPDSQKILAINCRFYYAPIFGGPRPALKAQRTKCLKYLESLGVKVDYENHLSLDVPPTLPRSLIASLEKADNKGLADLHALIGKGEEINDYQLGQTAENLFKEGGKEEKVFAARILQYRLRASLRKHQNSRPVKEGLSYLKELKNRLEGGEQ